MATEAVHVALEEKILVTVGRDVADGVFVYNEFDKPLVSRHTNVLGCRGGDPWGPRLTPAGIVDAEAADITVELFEGGA